MKRISQIAAGIGAALAGLAAAVFLHPRSGRRNRGVAAGVARRQGAGVAALVGSSMPQRPGSRGRAEERLAEQVRDHLESAFGELGREIQVSTHRRTVTLRGEVPQLDDIDTLEAASRAVVGVGDVNNLLRLRLPDRAGPGVPPTVSSML